jgi:hypothetical protein
MMDAMFIAQMLVAPTTSVRMLVISTKPMIGNAASQYLTAHLASWCMVTTQE